LNPGCAFFAAIMLHLFQLLLRVGPFRLPEHPSQCHRMLHNRNRIQRTLLSHAFLTASKSCL
jgi:hypothetical protein